MEKLLPVLISLCLCCSKLLAQNAVTANASIEANIISPVGARYDDEFISSTFTFPYQIKNESGKNSFCCVTPLTHHTSSTPLLQVFPGYDTYSLTISFDHVARSQHYPNEIYVDNISILPSNNSGIRDGNENSYILEAKLNIPRRTVPGNYFFGKPCQVTINFN